MWHGDPCLVQHVSAAEGIVRSHKCLQFLYSTLLLDSYSTDSIQFNLSQIGQLSYATLCDMPATR
jgi:hypothetical protein